jgi:hypothetical protein
VDLDADWNEYIDLQDRRWRAERSMSSAVAARWQRRKDLRSPQPRVI